MASKMRRTASSAIGSTHSTIYPIVPIVADYRRFCLPAGTQTTHCTTVGG